MKNKPANRVDVIAGEVIRECRKASGLSLGDVAAGLDVTFQQLQKYETGYNRISLSKFFEVCAEMGYDPALLIGEINRRARGAWAPNPEYQKDV